MFGHLSSSIFLILVANATNFVCGAKEKDLPLPRICAWAINGPSNFPRKGSDKKNALPSYSIEREIYINNGLDVTSLKNCLTTEFA